MFDLINCSNDAYCEFDGSNVFHISWDGATNDCILFTVLLYCIYVLHSAPIFLEIGLYE